MISKIIQDNSHYQQYIDFVKMKSLGQDYMILKAGSGSLSVDSKWEEHYKNATLAGIKISPYFWVDPIYDAVAQAKFFLKIVESKSIVWFELDWEQYWKNWEQWLAEQAWLRSNKTTPRPIVEVFSSQYLFNHFKAVYEYIEANSKYKLVIYDADWFMDSYCPQGYAYVKDKYTHWADYSGYSGIKLEKTWSEIEMLVPTTNVIPTLPLDYPLEKVLMRQFSGDRFQAIGVYANIERTRLSDLDLNKWVNKNMTIEQFDSSGSVINPIPTPIPTPGKESMIQSDKKLYVLNIPYISQLGTGASEHSNDCGAASGNMIIRAYTGENITVDQFYNETGSTYDAYLTATQIINVLSKHNVGTKWKISNMVNLMTDLRSGKPCICLISYKTLVNSMVTESKFTGFHFMLAIGYDIKNIYVHDPLWAGTGGKELAIPYDVFEQAWKDAGANPTLNPAYGCIVPNLKIGEPIIPITYKTYRVTVSVRNVRTGAGTSYTVVTSMEKHLNDTVQIDSTTTAEGLQWGHIYGTTYWIYMGNLVLVS